MDVTMREIDGMINEIYAPGQEIVAAIDQLNQLASEFEFKEDSRFKAAKDKLIGAMLRFQTDGVNRAVEARKAKAIINELNNGIIGNYLVNRAKEKQGIRDL